MHDRIKFYDKILRNKTIVKRLENMDFIPSIEELSILTYYSYKDINEKIKILEEIDSLPKINGIDDDCTNIQKSFISKYKHGLCLLYTENDPFLSFILTNMNDYKSIDSSCFNYPEKYGDENKILIYPTAKEAINDTKDMNLDVFKIYSIDKHLKERRLIASYGLMEDNKIHLYQITYHDDYIYEFRPEHAAPYINGSKLGYYLPFMKEPKYLGKSYIEKDDNGTYYAFINDDNDAIMDISWILNDASNSIATYDIICDYK